MTVSTTTPGTNPGTTPGTSPATSTAASGNTTTKADALSSLTGNFNDFLHLLMVQLQNQDPSAPMDTNQFTTQLVQFASVEQQINTNSNLTTLIQASQGSTLLQSSSLVGKQVEYTGDQASLQAGRAEIKFQTPQAKQVNVGIFSQSGVQLAQSTVQSTAGSNTFVWDGTTSSGARMPDGTYKVMVAGTDGSVVPFTLLGTATGVQRSGTSLTVSLGGQQVDFSTVQSVGQAGATQ